MTDHPRPTLRVADFLRDFTTSSQRVVLKDSYNGREYTRPDLHLDKMVRGCFPKIECRDGSYAHAVLVLWVDHDFEKEGRA